MSDVQEMLLESAGRLFREHCDASLHREAERGVWPGELWRLLDEMGFARAMVRESAGGAGLSLSQGFSLIGLAAQHALPLPLAETMLGAWLLDAARLDCPAGPLTVAPVSQSNPPILRNVGGTWSVTGTAPRVPWARNAVAIVVVASSAEGDRIALVDRRSVRIEPGTNVAGEPRDTVHFDNASVIGIGNAGLTFEDVRGLGAVARSVQMAGGCTRALELTSEYANLRVQFGRAIGKFQIIQQYVAMMATQTAAAGGAADLGIAALERDQNIFGIACAKARAGEAAGAVASLAHQVFGAIGFTQEHSLHLTTRRLWSWRDEFGSELEWSETLGRHVFQRGGKALWQQIAA